MSRALSFLDAMRSQVEQNVPVLVREREYTVTFRGPFGRLGTRKMLAINRQEAALMFERRYPLALVVRID